MLGFLVFVACVFGVGSLFALAFIVLLSSLDYELTRLEVRKQAVRLEDFDYTKVTMHGGTRLAKMFVSRSFTRKFMAKGYIDGAESVGYDRGYSACPIGFLFNGDEGSGSAFARKAYMDAWARGSADRLAMLEANSEALATQIH